MDKKLNLDMAATGKLSADSHVWMSFDSCQFICGGKAAVVTYTLRAKFTYDGKANDDIAKFSAVVEDVNGTLKYVFMHRCTGIKPTD
mmetsp:Transcript_19992/g.35682  ORF Transcript_19992/g.35682 Transcript_19992/m.35682 type:complete len:87 (-) Transcript_19992:157-417(-)